MTTNLESKNKQQLQNVVIIRSFAIIAVVLYHCYCPWLKAWNWYSCPVRPLYSFVFECLLVGRMPLFVTVSGYLFAHLFLDRGKYQTFWLLVKNKTRRLLVPCLLFIGLMCLCLQDNYWNNIIGYGYHTWFLKMLFVSFLVTWPILRYIHSKWLDILLLVVSVMMAFTPSIHYFAIEQFQKYYMFFLLGAMMYKYKEKLSIFESRKGTVFFLFCYIVVSAIILFRYIQGDPMGDIIHIDRVVVLSRMVLRIITVLLVFNLINIYLKNNPNFYSPVLFKLNKLSFGIYLFHFLYLKVIFKYLYCYTIDIGNEFFIIGPILLFIGIMFLSVVSAKLVNKTKWGSYLIG